MGPVILAVDDERVFLESVELQLQLAGYREVLLASDAKAVRELLEKRTRIDVALLDINMPGTDGLQLLREIKHETPQTECIMVTASDEVGTVVRAMRLGALDYLVKPLVPAQLEHAINQALERRRLLASLALHTGADTTLEHPEAFELVLTRTESMQRVLREAELHAASDIPVLITGETGVGKELLAAAIHRAGRRPEGPFRPVNMLALSRNLFESEFFGHRRGAFTSADRDHEGHLSCARGGTLFLDEIGDLSPELQGKLLRLLQEGRYTRVGDSRQRTADVRFVAATNRDLAAMVRAGEFRTDLYYRLRYAHVAIPPLRERKQDIPLLAAHFAGETGFSEDAMAVLIRHSWPGNVRELKGALEAAANLAVGGELLPEHLRLESVEPQSTSSGPVEVGSLEALAEVERRHILAVYNSLDRNKRQTALVLGIGLQTLYRRLKEYEVK